MGEGSSQIGTEVLREMVRLAEKLRDEQLETIERLNKYNLALVAFCGSFLSLLLTIDLAIVIVRVSGFCLLLSITASLLALRPRLVKGGTLIIDDDVKALRNGQKFMLERYLLDIADLTDQAIKTTAVVEREKQKWTILSAFFLALTLLLTYTLYAYA